VGVSAKPLDENIYKWHANIRGPEGTLYEGGVFHLEIEFPHSYPHMAPNITLFTSLPHPNVFGNTICLDVTQPLGREHGTGWSSVYSVQSVLIQLQSFLFEKTIQKDQAEHAMKVEVAVKNANEFKCHNRFCRHGGRLSAWPPFPAKEPELSCFLELDTAE
jgi:ubiquitin-protein ligase